MVLVLNALHWEQLCQQRHSRRRPTGGQAAMAPSHYLKRFRFSTVSTSFSLRARPTLRGIVLTDLWPGKVCAYCDRLQLDTVRSVNWDTGVIRYHPVLDVNTGKFVESTSLY